MRHIFSLTLILIAAAAAIAGKPVKTTQFKVDPPMHCQNCENRIKSNLRFERGVKAIETSLADQTVTVRYDSTKTDSTKLIQGFEKIGYTASTKQ